MAEKQPNRPMGGTPSRGARTQNVKVPSPTTVHAEARSQTGPRELPRQAEDQAEDQQKQQKRADEQQSQHLAGRAGLDWSKLDLNRVFEIIRMIMDVLQRMRPSAEAAGQHDDHNAEFASAYYTLECCLIACEAACQHCCDCQPAKQ